MQRRRLVLALGLACTAFAVRAEWRRDNEDACARIDQRLKDINSQRRAGYSAREGRKLQLQREKLEAQRREKCR